MDKMTLEMRKDQGGSERTTCYGSCVILVVFTLYDTRAPLL